MKQKGILLLIFLLSLTTITANGVGNYQEQTVNGIRFELGREPLLFEEGRPLTFSISAHDTSTEMPMEGKFSIRIAKDQKIFFASGDFYVKKTGPVFFLYTFPEHGAYEILVRLENGKEAVFPITVVGRERNVSLLFLTIVLLGILFTLWKRQKRA
ncbi:hypothetical protein HYS48_01050 [Candidatus Woesearchaeota archaeon]|nr:hypothetical protein [Candidatus Woesearchaeota archaeon]